MEASSIVVHGAAPRYRIESLIAEGGMGEVHVAVDETTGERVALKRLRAESLQRPRIVALFEREYHALRGLSHPNIVRVHDYGVDAGRPYYTMELIEGRDLADGGGRSVEECCSHLRDVASALALVHARRWVHRDVSLRNLRIARDGRCRLIDFGGLATFGAQDDVVGTAPMVPPEALRGDPLDQRSDLYSLGAAAYRLLTGRHAYAVRGIEDLPDAWMRRVSLPSIHNPEVPAELDELVMSLLRHDPSARPSDAAEVIDRLKRIANLPEFDERHEAASYLRVPALLGREAIGAALASRLGAAREGRGAAVRLLGERGVGRTRMLAETAIRAQLEGALVVRVDAEVHSGSFGVASAVTSRLLDVSEADVVEAARKNAPALAALDPAIAARLGPVPVPTLDPGSGEWRALVQAALTEFAVAIARERLLVLLVDNQHAADLGSAAWLASLAHRCREHRLVVVGTMRSADEVVARDATRVFAQWSAPLELEALRSDQTLELVRSLFGDVPNLGRLAERLHDVTGGNAGHTMELAQHLVDGGLVRYRDGAWVLPLELDERTVPGRLMDLVAQKLERLGPDARELAEAYAIAGASVPLELALALVENDARSRRHALLDTLMREGIVAVSSGAIRFTDSLLRAAVLKQTPENRRQAHHRRVADRLLASGSQDPSTRIDAGHHLIEAGDRIGGAELLASVVSSSRAMYEFKDDFATAVPVVRTALEIFRAEGRSDYEIAPLLGILARSSYYVDYRLAADFGNDAVVLLRRLTGTDLMARLRPFLGGKLAMIVGAVVARFRFARAMRKRRTYEFQELFVHLFAAVTALAGVATLCANEPEVTRLMEAIAPLTAFGPKSSPSGIHAYLHGSRLFLRERFAEMRAHYDEVLPRFEDPSHFPTLSAAGRKAYQSGVLYALAVADAMEGRASALAHAERLEAIGSASYRMIADQVRLLYAAMSGHTGKIREYQERIEVHAIQLGNSWQVEVWAPSTMLIYYFLTRDVMSLKRCVRELDALEAAIPTLGKYALGARACYHAQLGRLDVSMPLTERLCEETRAGENLGWPGVRSLAAVQRLALGDAQGAKALCLEAIELFRRFERPFDALEASNLSVLADALVALGEKEEAARRLDDAIAAHSHPSALLPMALLEMARARVASASGDEVAFALHVAEATTWVRRGENPSLLAYLRSLEERYVTTSPAARLDGERSDETTIVVGKPTDATERTKRT